MRHKHRVLEYWMLKAIGACPDQRVLFKEVFGYKCAISRKNLVKARHYGLDTMWFMRNLSGDNELRHDVNNYWDKCYQKYATNLNYGETDLWNDVFDFWIARFEAITEFYWSDRPFD